MLTDEQLMFVFIESHDSQARQDAANELIQRHNIEQRDCLRVFLTAETFNAARESFGCWLRDLQVPQPEKAQSGKDPDSQASLLSKLAKSLPMLDLRKTRSIVEV